MVDSLCTRIDGRCGLVGAVGSPGKSKTAIEAGVDAGIQPGDDFFAYANGGWLQATEFPPARNAGTHATRSTN